jgi:integrase
LGVKQVEALIRRGGAGRHRVAPGLYLQLGEGRAAWLFRFKLPGRKPRAMGLGAVGDVSLAQARELAGRARLQVRGGIDPLDARQDAAHALLVRREAPAFQRAAEEHIAALEPGWRSDKHAAQWTATLRNYAFPIIGDLPVDAITTDHILAVLNPIWTTKPETAGRVRGRIEAVLDAAKVRGWRAGENPARWGGHLALLLPKKSKVMVVEHHAALDWRRMPDFWRALGERDGMAAQALRFAILTASRSGEVRGMRWGEVGPQQRLWTIPAARMKAAREHRVPLSDAASACLPPRGEDDGLIFPARGGGMLSDMTLTALLRRMGWTDAAGSTITAHGFRSTFRDWAGEATAHPREVIEQALAHGLKDKAEAAYARGDLMSKRAVLMGDWASFATRPADAGEIIPLRPVTAGAAP